MSPLSDRTRLIAAATRRGQGRRGVNPPIERASTMLSDSAAVMRDETDGPTYGLSGTSAARDLRHALADLEGAKDAFLVPSGLAAVTVPLQARSPWMETSAFRVTPCGAVISAEPGRSKESRWVSGSYLTTAPSLNLMPTAAPRKSGAKVEEGKQASI